jgi:hypothetical protein
MMRGRGKSQHITPDEAPISSMDNELRWSSALQPKHVYAGTVSEKEALRRLAKKKVQKASRKRNRR